MGFARRAIDSRGSAQRVNRNMVVFLAADARRMEELEDGVREFLAWRSIAASEDRIRELDLSAQQAATARSRLRAADQAVGLRILDAYHWLLVPVQPLPDRPVTWETLRAEGARDRLAERASEKLVSSDLLRVTHGARSIRFDLDHRLPAVWERGFIRVGELWDYYCRHPYLPRLVERAVLDAGIAGVADDLAWDVEGFAVASGYDQATGRFAGLAIPQQDVIGQVTDSTLLVRPDLALAQRDAEVAAREAAAAAASPAGAAGVGSGGPAVTGAVVPVGPAASPGARVPSPEPQPEPAGPRNTRFFGVAVVSPDRYARDLTRLSQEVIQHLAAVDGAELEIRVEITARHSGGYPDDKVRSVTENARTLKFETYGFEDD